jgi:hypothetical protein
MPCKRCGCESPRVKQVDGVCKSTAACTKRLQERVGVRLVLENPPLRKPENQQAQIDAEIRHALYRHGLCIVCGTRPHSPGRPRCEACHNRNTPSP